MGHAITKKIEAALSANEWSGARRLLREELKRNPDEHWLWARLSETYYEEKKYRKALEHAQHAFQLAPECPMVLWDLAGAQFAAGDIRAAVSTYKKLLNAARGVMDKDGYDDPCWEGEQETLSLAVDCLYRVGVCLQETTKKSRLPGLFRAKCRLAALKAFRAYLESRPDYPGIYTAEDAINRIRELKEQEPHLPVVDFEIAAKAVATATRVLTVTQ